MKSQLEGCLFLRRGVPSAAPSQPGGARGAGTRPAVVLRCGPRSLGAWAGARSGAAALTSSWRPAGLCRSPSPRGPQITRSRCRAGPWPQGWAGTERSTPRRPLGRARGAPAPRALPPAAPAGAGGPGVDHRVQTPESLTPHHPAQVWFSRGGDAGEEAGSSRGHAPQGRWSPLPLLIGVGTSPKPVPPPRLHYGFF